MKQKFYKQTISQLCCKFVSEFDLEVLDLNNYEMPIYSFDREKEKRIHILDYTQKFRQIYY